MARGPGHSRSRSSSRSREAGLGARASNARGDLADEKLRRRQEREERKEEKVRPCLARGPFVRVVDWARNRTPRTAPHLRASQMVSSRLRTSQHQTTVPGTVPGLPEPQPFRRTQSRGSPLQGRPRRPKRPLACLCPRSGSSANELTPVRSVRLRVLRVLAVRLVRAVSCRLTLALRPPRPRPPIAADRSRDSPAGCSVATFSAVVYSRRSGC